MNSVNSEITDKNDTKAYPEWVFYDGECVMCCHFADQYARVLNCRGFGIAPLQAPWVQQRLQLPSEELLREMRVLTREGNVLSGADAIVYLADAIWWARLLRMANQVPIMRPLLQSAYSWVAKRRYCLNGSCSRVNRSEGMIGWIPLVGFSLWAFVLKTSLTPWAFMWILAVAMFFGFKWFTWWQTRAVEVRVDMKRVLGYLFLWPGMDAKTFLDARHRASRPTLGAWMFAVTKTLMGALLMWGVAPLVPQAQLLLKGWIGLIGLMLLLHFGSFHLIALAWQQADVEARPIMQAPLRSTSLTEFWGNRWNLGFRQLSHAVLFQPLRRRVGATTAGLATFLTSGFIHELVISVPAGAGYGLPTAYFMLQGVGVVLERSQFGQRLGFSQGVVGWLFTFAWTAIPAFWLFHPPFITQVAIPFLHVIGVQ